VLTNFDHDRQWFNTLIPPLHESAAVIVDCISRFRGSVRLILRYTTADIHKRYAVRVRRWNKKMLMLCEGVIVMPSAVQSCSVLVCSASNRSNLLITTTGSSRRPRRSMTKDAGLMTSLPGRYKTELCRSYVETGGWCRYGVKCQFAHGVGELRSVDRHPRYKTQLCRTYHTLGFCTYGQRCHFIHNMDEVQLNRNIKVCNSSSSSSHRRHFGRYRGYAYPIQGVAYHHSLE